MIQLQINLRHNLDHDFKGCAYRHDFLCFFPTSCRSVSCGKNSSCHQRSTVGFRAGNVLVILLCIANASYVQTYWFRCSEGRVGGIPGRGPGEGRYQQSQGEAISDGSKRNMFALLLKPPRPSARLCKRTAGACRRNNCSLSLRAEVRRRHRAGGVPSLR